MPEQESQVSGEDFEVVRAAVLDGDRSRSGLAALARIEARLTEARLALGRFPGEKVPRFCGRDERCSDRTCDIHNGEAGPWIRAERAEAERDALRSRADVLTAEVEAAREVVRRGLEDRQRLAAEVETLRKALENVRDNYDCDDDAHRYGTTCRVCSARAALEATEPKEDGHDTWAREWAEKSAAAKAGEK